MKKRKKLSMVLAIIMLMGIWDGLPITSIRAVATDSIWKAIQFGSNAKASTNYVEPSNPGTIDGMIKLTALEGGGKITSAHDGLTFYYTEIDSAKDNFVLSADVKVDFFAKPSPDNQEGFGLMARDVIGKDGDSTMFSSNVVAIGGYYGTTQAFIRTGSTNTLGNEGIVQTATKWRTQRPSEGNTYPATPYRLTLQKTNSGYTASLNNEAATKATFYEPDVLNVQDSKIYVGFYAARLATIEVSNVAFSVSDAASDPPQTTAVPTPITPSLTVTSLSTSSKSDYALGLNSNVNGTIAIKQGGTIIATNEAVIANQPYLKNTTVLINKTTNFEMTFTPDSNQLLTSYSPIVKTSTVYYKNYITPDGAIHVSTTGTSAGTATIENPIDIDTAIRYVKDGQTIYMHGGTYNRTATVKIYAGCDGVANGVKTLAAYNGESVVFNFGSISSGFSVAANYWHIYGIDITKATGVGFQISGSYNKIENCKSYANGDTGIIICRTGVVSREFWPAYNLVLNCEAYDNKDASENNADGFAAKITSGVGNVFRGCIAHNNIDDGWDLYTKIEFGPIGAVLIEDCIAYDNGTLTNGYLGKGDKNGFKLGGEGIAVPHIIKNSISFNNGARGFDSNGNPSVKAYDCVSYDNKGANISFSSYVGIPLDFTINHFVSYRSKSGTVDRYPTSAISDGNYFCDGVVSANKSGNLLSSLNFASLSPALSYQRDAGGNIIWGDFLKFSAIKGITGLWADDIVINENGAIANPYDKAGANIVRINVTGVMDPTIENKKVMFKGVEGRYTNYNGESKFVALVVNGSLTIDDVLVVDGAPTKLLYGDVTLNNTADATDVNSLKGAVVGNRTPVDCFEFLASDVSGEGAVNSSDYNLLKAFIAGNLMVLPVHSK